MMRLVAFIIGLFVTLIPAPYRRWWPQSEADMAGPALVSGILQFLGSMILFVAGYTVTMQSGLGAVGEIFRDAPVGFTNTSVAGGGAIVTAEYVIQPSSFFLIYFAIEGGVRSIAALVTSRVVGTLSLVTLAWIHSAVEPRLIERSLAARGRSEIL